MHVLISSAPWHVPEISATMVALMEDCNVVTKVIELSDLLPVPQVAG